MGNDETFSKWVAEALKDDDIAQGINDFRTQMWGKWGELYKAPGFIYGDKERKKRGGIFSVTNRAHETHTGSGVIATYSPGWEEKKNKPPEYKYSRDIFNRKKIRLNNAPNAGSDQELIFFSYEAPLLRVTTEKDGRFRIHADLVALADQDIVIFEAKLPGGDSLDKAILQAYGYAFFLACHLASNHQDDVIEHIQESFKKFQGSDDAANNIKVDQPVHYMIAAPSQYFYENLIVSDNVCAVLAGLGDEHYQLKDKPLTNCKLPVNPQFAGFVIIEDEHLCFKDFDSLMQYQADVYSWQGLDQSLSYAVAERLAQIRCKRYSGLFSEEAKSRGEYESFGKEYKVSYCLPRKNWEENLFSGIRNKDKKDDPQNAVDFFEKRKISWHHKGQNHLLSSQIYCVNFLLPFADKPEALKELLQPIFHDNIQKMLLIEKDRHVTFEWDGRDISEKGEENNYLGEYGFSAPRGTHSTYADAAVKFQTKDKETQIILIEWKYTEKYNETSMAEGKEGARRLATYRKVCQESGCPIRIKGFNIDTDADAVMKILFYEPFYQLFREQLLAQEIEKHNKDINTVSVLHICPAENDAYINNVTSPVLRKKFPDESVLGIWKKLVSIENRFTSISQKELYKGFPHDDFPEFKNWADYMSTRYRLEE